MVIIDIIQQIISFSGSRPIFLNTWRRTTISIMCMPSIKRVPLLVTSANLLLGSILQMENKKAEAAQA